jgi:zinc protease
MVIGARGQRPFLAYAPVQTDKTKESMVEINKEFQNILKDKPATDEELQKVKRQSVLELSGTWETMGAVAGSIHEMVRFGLPEDYFETYSERVRNLSLEQVRKAAETMVHPAHLTWVIVGDLAKVQDEIKQLGLGEITLINADGQVIGQAEVSK